MPSWAGFGSRALALFAGLMVASPDLVADEDRATWFKSLKMPGSPVPCCDVSDCQRTEAQWHNGQWWAVVRGILMPIPRDRELERKSIDGDAYVCASSAADRMIFCFIRPNLPM